MFGEGYPFDYRNFKLGKPLGEPWEKEHLYTFRCRNNYQYMVIVEEYDYNFFAIKFHLKKDRDNKKKYEILTNYNDAPRVIRTCVDIMIALYNKNPYCSFGFKGSNSDSELPANTKRFRIYKQVMEYFFSLEKFFHFYDKNSIAYLLLNKDNPLDTPTGNLFELIKNMLLFHYIIEKTPPQR